MARSWYSYSLEETFARLESSEAGLMQQEATERLEQYGPNSLPEGKPRSLLRLFIGQFQSPLIYVLLAASVVVFALGEVVDGAIIFAVLLFNAVVGIIQEGRAQNTLLALKKYVETNATVLRGGKELIVPDREVVPGDILILQEGERIPADARVVFSHNLTLDEASLTGESVPIHKGAEAIKRNDLPAAEQRDMVFKGTYVVAGSGRAVAVDTGLSTVIGRIAGQISSIETEIPLQASIRHLSRVIIAAVAVISSLLFFVGLLYGHSGTELFAAVVSLSVSIIPEGLPIVMTLVLATGVWRMSKRNALVKRLQAVEALGQARVIAVDKTGTITKNELVVRKVWVAGTTFGVAGAGYEPKGDVTLNASVVDAARHEALSFLGKLSALTANARLLYDEEEHAWRIAGDPTEAAMLVFGEKLGHHKDALLLESSLTSEIPFDYRLKYHATVNGEGKETLLTVSGAPEVVLALCHGVWHEGTSHALAEEQRKELEGVFERMSAEGLRVIAVAVRHHPRGALTPESVKGLSLIGFLGMQDTLRPAVKEAVHQAREADIRVAMITGDHKITAQAIGREAGIYRDGDLTLTGREVQSLFDAELAKKLGATTVFARVTPEDKMRIINAYKKRGDIVAMTGDGVNDAPSLVAADLGVAMGVIGTEVAKEASDIVLLDDNFGSIVAAVEEGRSIYKTMKKVMLYLFSTSAGEVLTIAAAFLLGYPLPILAAQIIWLNFVTDGFLDVALAMEPKEQGLLSGAFKRPNNYLVDRLMVRRMALMALPMMAGTLFLFSQYYGTDLAKAWTMSLTTLAVFQWFNAWNCRSESKSIFSAGILSNPYLVGATATIILLQCAALYTPLMQTLLKTVPLGWSEWLIIIPIAASIVVVEELRKFFYRKRARA